MFPLTFYRSVPSFALDVSKAEVLRWAEEQSKAARQGTYKASRDEAMRGTMPKPDEVRPFDFEGAVAKIAKSWRPPSWDGTSLPTESLKTCETLGVMIPAYSPEKAEKAKPTAEPPFIYKPSRTFATYLHNQEFSADGDDLDIEPFIGPMDIDVVCCSFCGAFVKRDTATFGMGSLIKLRTTEIVVINKVRTVREKVVHVTPRKVACKDHSLYLQATADEDGNLVKHTKFPEMKG